MAATATPLPLSLTPPSSRVSSHAQTRLLDVEARRLPLLSLRLNDAKLAPLLATFPLYLHSYRAALLPEATRGALKLPKGCELLVEAAMPELLGAVPLAHWPLSGEAAATLAEANASAGALLVEIVPKKGAPIQRALSPFWLDWQGWSGLALRAATALPPADGVTLRYSAWELAQRADPPSGLHTARAFLHAALNEPTEAAGACLDEVALHLTSQRLPGAGALQALVLLGQLLRANGDLAEAAAALALALWLSPNHPQALAEMAALEEDEEVVTESLARLSRLPQRPATYSTLLREAAERLGQPHGTLEGKVEALAKQRKEALFAEPPAWLTQGSHLAWMQALGL